MATLTGFTRPAAGDPIIAEDMRAHIATDTGKTITFVEIKPSSIDVTGTIVGGDTSAIQASIDTYVYSGVGGPFIPMASMANTVPMPDNASKVITAHAAYTVDSTLQANIDKKTANRTYINGVAKNGTAQTGDLVEWIVTLTTSGGTVTDYVTTEGASRTSGGTALLSTLFPDSIMTNFIDSSGVYAQGSPTVTSNKTVSVPFTKQGFSGVVLLSTNLIGAVAMNTIPDGVTVKVRLVGIAA